jgi:hypothetical protein
MAKHCSTTPTAEEPAMYSPTLGRFITTDPAGFQAGDVNLYRFVEDNPTNLLDPSGLGVPDEIKSGRLEYYQNVGWVDWDHAAPDAGKMVVERLREALKNAPSTAGRAEALPPHFLKAPGYVIVTINDPGDAKFPGKHYYVKAGLTEKQFWAVALDIHMDYQLFVERFQAKGKLIGKGGSSFSQEDLMSNLIGFLRYQADPTGMKLKTPADVAKHFGFGEKLSKDEALELLKKLKNDLGHPDNKHYHFSPVDHNKLTTSFKDKKMTCRASLDSTVNAVIGGDYGQGWWVPYYEIYELFDENGKPVVK